MKALLVPLGSAGDVHPFVGLGAALKARGHEVTIITNEHFGPLVRHQGLEFVPLGTEAEFLAVLEDPDLWHPTRAFGTVMRKVVEGMRPSYELIAERFVPGETVVVSSMLGFGPRIANERLGVPLVSVHLQPSVIRSLDAPPIYPVVGDLGRWPRPLRRMLFWFMDVAMIDRVLAPPVNRFRAELELPPVRQLFDRWMHSPELVIGLFPEWFGPPQRDWPPHTLLTGFRLYDEATVREPDPAVAAFLDAGEPPVVVTPGSAMKHGRDFFARVIEALQRLGRRGALLTRYREQLPDRLPDGIAHFGYVPFSRILPRAAALVHHGGIGTTAQALAAGIPQLVMPMAHDQPDNVARLERLGVGRSLPPKRFRAPAVVGMLGGLLESEEVAAQCRAVAGRVAAQRNSLEQAALAIESVVNRTPSADRSLADV
jgi:UDP:flavonoid glycosyltransferase YjiC (YdhE family)